MKMAVLTAALAALVSCGGKEEAVEATSPAPAPSSEAHSPTEVRLGAEAAKEAGIGTAEVKTRSGRETIEVTGRLTVNEERTWRVGAVTEGRITRIDARVGDRVEAGQILAYFHTHDVHEGRAEYAKAQSEMVRLKSQEAHAVRVRDRAKTLYELKAGSLEAWEHAEAEVKNVQQLIVQAEAEVERTRTHLVEFLGVKIEEPEHHAAGKHDVEDWVPVRAPATGVVMERAVSVGSVTPAAGLICTITDPSLLWLLAEVNEEYYAQLRVGMPVSVRVQAHPGREFRGRIVKIGEKLDPDTRTVQARVELANGRGLLKPEMYAAAALELPGRREMLTIPEGALQELEGQTVVFADRGEGRYEAIPVVTGESLQGEVEVKSGLEAGDRVVVRGAFVVKSQLLKSSLAEE
ncbi:MAG: efflux RND transporter periplasmic adaptor subunit [Bryobacteraceae bacterium]